MKRAVSGKDLIKACSKSLPASSRPLKAGGDPTQMALLMVEKMNHEEEKEKE